MKNILTKIGEYFISMNSEDTKVSIKRNIAWLIAILFVWSQVYALVKLEGKIEADKYIDLVKFVTVLDAVMILLILGITSIEKIQSLVQSIRGQLKGIPPAGAVAPVVLLLLLPLLFTGCASERNFVKYHDRHDSTAAHYCAKWYPVRDSIHERVVLKEGEVQYVPGETVYANCDSAYRAALDEAAAHGTKVIIKKVAVDCPPSTVRVDTFTDTNTVYVENTARVTDLQYQSGNKTKEADKYNTAYVKWKKHAMHEGYLLCALLLSGLVYGYFRLKSSFLRK